MFEIPIFISHSWTYSNHYETLASWIFNQNWNSNGIPITFWDTSVPKDNPIHFASSEVVLEAAILQRIQQAHVVVIPTGMYAQYSYWIRKEIDGAKLKSKPILAVNPWGQERKASTVISACSKYVGWNSKSVVQGIWDLSPYG